jgi:hypothetical protein
MLDFDDITRLTTPLHEKTVDELTQFWDILWPIGQDQLKSIAESYLAAKEGKNQNTIECSEFPRRFLDIHGFRGPRLGSVIVILPSRLNHNHGFRDEGEHRRNVRVSPLFPVESCIMYEVGQTFFNLSAATYFLNLDKFEQSFHTVVR